MEAQRDAAAPARRAAPAASDQARESLAELQDRLERAEIEARLVECAARIANAQAATVEARVRLAAARQQMVEQRAKP